MKKTLLLILSLVTLLPVSCISYPDQGPAKEQTGPKVLSSERFTHEGHTYIKFVMSHVKDGCDGMGYSVVHDPDCPGCTGITLSDTAVSVLKPLKSLIRPDNTVLRKLYDAETTTPSLKTLPSQQ